MAPSTKSAWLWLCLAVLPALAQEAAPVAKPASRAQLWTTLRETKARDLRPPERTGLEKFLYSFRERRVMERLMAGFHGFHPKAGGLHTGSGFAAGTEYRAERLADGILDVRASVMGSTRLYEKFDFQIGMPRLLHEHCFLDFTATYRNYPQERYYGLGPGTRKQDRTNFRLEDTTYLGSAGVHWRRWIRTGVRGGIIQTNVGPGTDSRFAPTERLFTPRDTPALDLQPNFFQLGAFAQADYRDEPGNPRSGGNYIAQWNYFGDRTLLRHTFRRFDGEVQQYFPFFNRRRVIAFRAKTSIADAGAGQTIPFYMEPTLGGSEDLRGFREFRFRDKNLMVYNLEYRWEVFSGLDMALFGDAGKVFPHRSQFNLAHLEGAYGIGLRFNTEKAVFLRLDVGKSHEGMRFFFKFGHVF